MFINGLRKGNKVVLGIAFICIASMSVIELSARISARYFVNQKIDMLEKAAVSINADENNTGKEEFKKRRLEISNYQTILDDLEHLALTGANSPRETVHAIRHRIAEFARKKSESSRIEQLRNELDTIYVEIQMNKDKRTDLSKEAQIAAENMAKEERGLGETQNAGRGPVWSDLKRQYSLLENEIRHISTNEDRLLAQYNAIKKEIAETQDRETNWEPNIYVTYNKLLYFPSEFLLAITMILCGGTGAILSSFRSRRPKYFSTVFNGILAGFVAFLVVKGGKFLFLINTTLLD